MFVSLASEYKKTQEYFFYYIHCNRDRTVDIQSSFFLLLQPHYAETNMVL